MHERIGFLLFLGLAGSCAELTARQASASAPDHRLAAASRRDEAGWIVLHLEGDPGTVGYQYGWLAAGEIDDALATLRGYVPGACHRDWSFFRTTARELFWPRLDGEQREEIEGIVAGARARGKALDREDLTALNGWMEIAWYYLPTLGQADNVAPGNCSAFAATGSWTRDGGIVMGHNAWIDYCIGERWNLVLDIVPAQGHRLFMDSFPGFIHSGDDFALNDAGLIVTETTIAGFRGFDPAGVPEFARARHAVQYAGSIDEWAEIMRAHNNGGYANSWLVGDLETGEIARLELGLRNSPLERTRDGFFVGSNFPADARLRAEETGFDPTDAESCCTARRARWEALMAEFRGKIDVAAGQRFLADHLDARSGRSAPSGRTLCGHLDLDPLGSSEWQLPPFDPLGAVQSKVTDSSLAADLSFWACMGHACGMPFEAEPFLAAHPEFAWQRPFLRDLPAGRWTLFAAAGADARVAGAGAR